MVKKDLKKGQEPLKTLQNGSTPTQLKELLTREQTADLLHITLTTLWRWTKQGKLKSYGIGGRIYYKTDEVLNNALIPLNNKKVG